LIHFYKRLETLLQSEVGVVVLLVSESEGEDGRRGELGEIKVEIYQEQKYWELQ
jgi:hypothetical protein